MKIKKLPNVLALHLKRFKYQDDVQKYIKLAYRVAFPLELRLFNTVDDAQDPDRLYELFAIVVHIGKSVFPSLFPLSLIFIASPFPPPISALRYAVANDGIDGYAHVVVRIMVTTSPSSKAQPPGLSSTTTKSGLSKNPTFPNTSVTPLPAQPTSSITKPSTLTPHP